VHSCGGKDLSVVTDFLKPNTILLRSACLLGKLQSALTMLVHALIDSGMTFRFASNHSVLQCRLPA
jgi:hypothetical protein